MRPGVALFIFTTVLVSCASPDLRGTKEVRFGEVHGDESAQPGKVSQAELQEDLQRFSSQFTDRITQAAETWKTSSDPLLQRTVMKHLLRCVSSALEIATGPYPEVNLLDMAVFVRLNREVLEEYWVPKVYGARGEPLLEAFRKSERDLSRVADKVSTPAQQERLQALIRAWRRENPDQVYVEWVRLSDFSKKAGRVEAERSESTSGMLSSVKAAVSSADQGLLLANRALFLGQRLPFLLRLQARLGSQEILADSLRQLGQAGGLIEGAGPLVQDLSLLTARLESLMVQTGPFLADFRKYFPLDTSTTLSWRLGSVEHTTANLAAFLTSAERLTAAATPQGMQAARAQVDGLIWTVTKALLGVGFFWGLVGWGGYYLVKRPDRRARALLEEERRAGARPPSSGAAA